MKNIFNNWRHFSQPILLSEGRISDTKKKYPELDKQGLIDILINRDPSGNQKYLAWGAKQLATQTVKKQSSAKNIAELIEKYHKLLPILARANTKNKDINSFKNWGDLGQLLNRAQQIKDEQDAQKAKVAKEKEEAMKGTTFLFKDENFFMVRPHTKDASCYWGRGAVWCISATKYENYFDQYTKQGKAFFFLLMKNKKNFSSTWEKHKMIALVYSSDYGGFEEAYDAQNNTMGEDELLEIMAINILGPGVAEAVLDLRANYSDFAEFQDHEPELAELLIKKYKELNLDADNIDGDEFFREQVMDQWSNINAHAESNMYDHPPGPSEMDYQKIEDEYDLKHVGVWRDEYESWTGSTSFEFDELELVEDGEQVDIDDIEGEIEDEVKSLLDDHYFYPDEIEYYDNRINLSFHPSYDEASGLDEFDSFMSRMHDMDQSYEEVKQGIISILINKKFIDISQKNIGKLVAKLTEKELVNFDFEAEGLSVEVTSNTLFMLDKKQIDSILTARYSNAAEAIKSRMDPTVDKDRAQAALDQWLGHTERSVRNQSPAVVDNIISSMRESGAKENFASHIQDFLKKAYQSSIKQLTIPGIEPEDKFKKFRDELGQVIAPENIDLFVSGLSGRSFVRIQVQEGISDLQTSFVSEFVEFFDENFNSLQELVGLIYRKALLDSLRKLDDSVEWERYMPKKPINESKKKKLKILLKGRTK